MSVRIKNRQRAVGVVMGCFLMVTAMTGCATAPSETAPTTTVTTVSSTVVSATTTVSPAATTETTAAPTTATPTTAVKPNPIREVTISKGLADRLDRILSETGKSPLQIVNYVRRNARYKWTPEQSLEKNAEHLLDYGTGACYNYAALTFLLFQQAGFPVCYVTGTGRAEAGSSYHCWIAAECNGKWMYYDSLYRDGVYMTADQLLAHGYRWDRTVYPY